MKKLLPLLSKQRESRRLAEWKKFLKDDADWDWGYILRVLAYKIARTRKCMANGLEDKNTLNPKLKVMRDIEALLEKVALDDYENDKEIRKYFSSDKVLSKFSWINNKKIRKNDMRRALNRAAAERDIDLRQAFDLIATHIYEWWD